MVGTAGDEWEAGEEVARAVFADVL